MDPKLGGEENLYSEAGFPAGNFVASPPPNHPSFPAPLRGSPLRTPFFTSVLKNHGRDRRGSDAGG